jgi:hypothetical protein
VLVKPDPDSHSPGDEAVVVTDPEWLNNVINAINKQGQLHKDIH